MSTEYILYAVKKGAEDRQEEIITCTKDKARLAKARKWAEEQGFDRFRTTTYSGEAPDFTRVLNK